MIKIILNNEELDIDAGQVVTFKKSQQLNGIQNQFSFSNNFNLPLTSKNRRLLKINYLPNSKAKSMTIGYDVDIVLNGCIFLKKQKLKVQKENEKSVPVFIIFTDSFFIAKAKETLLNDLDLEVIYNKTQSQFLALNESTGLLRTAPISAQDESNFVVVEEVPGLLNLVQLVSKILEKMGYAYFGTFFNDLDLKEWYVSPNYSQYGVGGAPKFDNNLNVNQFLLQVLKTFNAYIDVSDSERSIGIYLWKDIETIKDNFIDYSDNFERFTDYAFEGGLAKKNIIEYSGSQPFYNSFFENNKSIVETGNYLKSDFGAGSLRLFDDQELTELNLLPTRTIGEPSQTSEINLFKFEATASECVYYVSGSKQIANLKKAYSPNILEIFTEFHAPYVKNIALPTIANLNFKYDAIFLANLKLQNVFFIKQLSTYWLPLELNYSTNKDKVTIKSLMIEKSKADVPIIFDFNLSLGFFENYTILDASPLYSSQNVSPQSIFTVFSFDQTKNRIFVTGNDNIRTEILATPFNIDIADTFIFEVENIEPTNVISNSDLFFQFTSQEGGVSRIGKINIAHNGRAKYISEFRMITTPTEFIANNVQSYTRFLNYAQKITTPINIPTTIDTQIGDVATQVLAVTNFKMLDLIKPQLMRIRLDLGASYFIQKTGETGDGRVVFKINYNVYKNGAFFITLHSNGVDLTRGNNSRTVVDSLVKFVSIFVSPGDDIAIAIQIIASNDPLNGQTINATFLNLKYTLTATEQV